jgi:hypothetical protein
MTAQDRRVAVVASVLAMAVASFVACSGGAPNDASAPASTTPAPPAAPAATDDPAPPPPTGKRPLPKSAMDCTNIATEITNDPPLDGGIAMNNATTAGDAGGSDRLVSVMEVIKQHRDAYRCCFDLWGKDHVGEAAKIALVLELDPTGKLTKASFKEAETDLKDKDVEACMSDVAKKQTFPASPSGKETTYTHRFEFKARSR